MIKPFIGTYKITQKFGKTAFSEKHPELYRKFGKIHPGIDFALPRGTKVIASFAGVVNYAGFSGRYGYSVKIQKDNIIAVYAHLDKEIVKKGQKIKQGEVIGYSGNSGWTTGPHLHFELRDLSRGDRLRDQVFEPKFGSTLSKGSKTYVVKKGDSLWKISKKFYGKGILWKKIYSANKKMIGNNPNLIYPGQKLRIP